MLRLLKQPLKKSFQTYHILHYQPLMLKNGYEVKGYGFKQFIPQVSRYFCQLNPKIKIGNEQKKDFQLNSIKNKNEYEHQTTKPALEGLVVVMGLGLIICTGVYVYKWRNAPRPFDNFENKTLCEEALIPLIPDLDVTQEKSFLRKNIASLLEDSVGVIVIAGESGIGKTTAFKSYVHQRRAQGLPSYYMKLSSTDTLESMLKMCFNTDNKQLVLDSLKLYSKKGKVPLLVIDDIQKAYSPNGDRFEPGILEFFQDFKANGGQVFLLSSVSSVAYKIRSYSGYKGRSIVFEMEPRSWEVIQSYIKKEVNKMRKYPLTEEEIKEYCRLFDGNMLMLNWLYKDNSSTFTGKFCFSLTYYD